MTDDRISPFVWIIAIPGLIIMAGLTLILGAVGLLEAISAKLEERKE